jgi:hypothetical protein
VTFRECHFVNFFGESIINAASGVLTLSGCTFQDNNVNNSVLLIDTSDVTVNNCTFQNTGPLGKFLAI